MQTAWIRKAAENYGQHLVTQRRENDQLLREEELRRSRENRVATEGPIVGQRLWEGLQATLKGHVAEFNQEYGEEMMRTKALGDGTFEVRLGELGGPERIAALTYVSAPPTLSWQVFGGAKSVPLSVGLKSASHGTASVDELLFTTGRSYPSLDELSQQVISTLLPC
ncbi:MULTISPECIES: hypothetical protein [Acidobacteriaceae]|uniref:hypothetical protein n=1 Tax=Acidobacteriaceae TaxID=204434 RepID=UPI00131D1838|nr:MULTISPECIES: hypothetical protein [Acidobacteriaceae]MDW5266920.1 hypothetical protein [Edaphobacter sp.]